MEPLLLYILLKTGVKCQHSLSCVSPRRESAYCGTIYSKSEQAMCTLIKYLKRKYKVLIENTSINFIPNCGLTMKFYDRFSINPLYFPFK